MRTTTQHTVTVTITLLAAVLAFPVLAAMVPFETTFGSDNDGDGGFTTSGSGTWSTQTDALRLTYPSSSSPANASALQQFTVDTTPGTVYNISLQTTIVDNGGGNSNRYGIRLFGNSSTDTGDGLTVLFSYNYDNPDDPSKRYLDIRSDGFPGDREVTTGWSGIGGDAADGVTYTIFGTVEYDASNNINLSFQVTDGTTTSSAVTHTVSAASYTDDYFGFAMRAEDSATFDHEVFSFTVVPEPASLALLTIATSTIVLRRRA